MRKIKAGKKRGRAVESAKKRYNREVLAKEKQKYAPKKMKAVSFDTDISSGKLMLRFESLAKSYGRTVVFTDLDFEIRGKEKIWLFGPNGVGKTTLVKIIMNEETPTAGVAKLGENVRVGYFAQKQTSLDFSKDLLTHYMDETHCTFGAAISILNNFLFDKEACKKRVRNLSPGERARFAFAIFAHENYDLLILDEPTNHLDIETKEIIEKSLGGYEGTLLLVSHDRYFVEQVGVTKILNLKAGKLTYY